MCPFMQRCIMAVSCIALTVPGCKLVFLYSLHRYALCKEDEIAARYGVNSDSRLYGLTLAGRGDSRSDLRMRSSSPARISNGSSASKVQESPLFEDSQAADRSVLSLISCEGSTQVSMANDASSAKTSIDNASALEVCIDCADYDFVRAA